MTPQELQELLHVIEATPDLDERLSNHYRIGANMMKEAILDRVRVLEVGSPGHPLEDEERRKERRGSGALRPASTN